MAKRKTRREQELAIAAEFGERVRATRICKGMTQEELAEATDRHPTFISNLERGYRVPSLPTVLRIATGLRVEPSELIDDIKGH